MLLCAVVANYLQRLLLDRFFLNYVDNVEANFDVKREYARYQVRATLYTITVKEVAASDTRKGGKEL